MCGLFTKKNAKRRVLEGIGHAGMKLAAVLNGK